MLTNEQLTTLKAAILAETNAEFVEARTAAEIKAMLPIEGGVSPAVADKLRELLK